MIAWQEFQRYPRAKSQVNDCHLIPSAVEPDRIAAATNRTSPWAIRITILLRCHQKEFYRGDRRRFVPSVIRAGVRLTSRDVYSQFPSPNAVMS